MMRARGLMLGLLVLSSGNTLAHGHGGGGGHGHGGHGSFSTPSFGGHASSHGVPVMGFYPSSGMAPSRRSFGYGVGYGLSRLSYFGGYVGYATPPLMVAPPAPLMVYGDGAACTFQDGQPGLVYGGQCVVMPYPPPCPPPPPAALQAPGAPPPPAEPHAPGFGALAPATRNNANITREDGKLVLYENGVRMGTMEVQGGLPETSEAEELARAVALTSAPVPPAAP